jgi:hypothetical protein
VAGTNPTTNWLNGIDKWLEQIQPPIWVMALKSGWNKSSHLIKIPWFKKHTITTREVKKVAGSHPATLLCNNMLYHARRRGQQARIGTELQQAKKRFKETLGTPTTCLCY